MRGEQSRARRVRVRRNAARAETVFSWRGLRSDLSLLSRNNGESREGRQGEARASGESGRPALGFVGLEVGDVLVEVLVGDAKGEKGTPREVLEDGVEEGLSDGLPGAAIEALRVGILHGVERAEDVLEGGALGGVGVPA